MPTEARSYDNAHILTFNEGSHRYFLDDKAVPSVTTFIKQSLPDGGGLAFWRSAQTAEYLNDWWLRQAKLPSVEDLSGATKAACFAFQRALDEAGKIGTAVHRYVEIYDLEGPAAAQAALPALASGIGDDAARSLEQCLGGFESYVGNRAAYKTLRNEGLVASYRHFFAGTFDRLGERQGKVVLTDFKTSKAIYFSHLVQLGAYSLAIKDWLGIKVQELEILRFGKDGTFEPLTVTGRHAILQWERQAIRCLETYRAIKTFGS